MRDILIVSVADRCRFDAASLQDCRCGSLAAVILLLFSRKDWRVHHAASLRKSERASRAASNSRGYKDIFFLLSPVALVLIWGNWDFFLLSPVALVLMCGNQEKKKSQSNRLGLDVWKSGFFLLSPVALVLMWGNWDFFPSQSSRLGLDVGICFPS